MTANDSAEIELSTKGSLHQILPCGPRDERKYTGLLDARW